MPESDDRIRFAFTIEEGPNARLTNGGWRLWVHGDTTYLTCKTFGGIWKVSLHEDVAWRLALTREHASSDNPVLPADHPRAPWTFTPPPFVGGRRLAFAVVLTRPALLPEQLDQDAVHIRVEDRWDQVTVAYVHMTEPGIEYDPQRPVGGPLVLANGRRVWLSAGTEEVEPMAPEPQVAGVIVEPMWPEKHGVAAPGLMLRGAHLG